MKLSEILEVIDQVAGKFVLAQKNKIGYTEIGVWEIIKYQDAEVDSISTYDDGSLLIMLKNNKGGESNETT